MDIDRKRRDLMKAAAASILLPSIPTAYAQEASTLGSKADPKDAPQIIFGGTESKPASITRVEKGDPTVYAQSRDELRYIGMPVGGIGCGTLYLSGDGRLWMWDIFNLTENYLGQHRLSKDYVATEKTTYPVNASKGLPATEAGRGSVYIEPFDSTKTLGRDPKQGFLVSIKYENQDAEIIRSLDSSGNWTDIEFLPTYPVGKVKYIDKNLGLNITLEAFTPFIPLNEDDSSIPTTIMSFSVENTGPVNVEVSLLGWLENRIAPISGDQYKDGKRINQAFEKEKHRGFRASLQPGSAKPHYDVGEMALTALDLKAEVYLDITLPLTKLPATPAPKDTVASKSTTEGSPLIGGVKSTKLIAPGQKGEFNFVVAWYFKNFEIGYQLRTFDAAGEPKSNLAGNDNGRYYGEKFTDVLNVCDYIANNFKRLSDTTRLWVDLWYNQSTLPYWFAERTLCNVSTLATSTTLRLKSGRMWAFEGIVENWGGHGTCTHVYLYAQGASRLFPALERYNREHVDLGAAFLDMTAPPYNGRPEWMIYDGGVQYRGEGSSEVAIDGQAGVILRCYREHQMAPSVNFLKNTWPRIKRATQFLFRQDTSNNGLVDTQLLNTLDARWAGEMGWTSGLTIAAVEAARRMAKDMADAEFEAKCKAFVDLGNDHMVEKLFHSDRDNFGWFIQVPPKEGDFSTTLGSYNTCHIDQVLGQSWAHQVGLGRLWDRQKTLTALKTLMHFNYVLDVSDYVSMPHPPRPYALPGEAGMVMNSNPSHEDNPYHNTDSIFLMYMRECMTGFEHQVAAHLMAEGMVEDSFTVTKAIHARYHPKKRNPFNEIEWGSHYGRAMASYGSFITACGFTHHGPNGYIGFAPKFNQASFKAPFTSASGWGTYEQKTQEEPNTQQHVLKVYYGSLTISSIGLPAVNGKGLTRAYVTSPRWPLTTKVALDLPDQDGNFLIKLPRALTLKTGDALSIKLS